jgi:phage tail sheath protein FI
MFERIDNSVVAPQGISPSDYTASIALLQNKDEYQFDIISAPGLTMEKNAGTVGELANMCSERGDAIAIIDPSVYASTVAGTIQDSSAVDSSYAAAYWPWVQVRVPSTGKLAFVPASTIMPGVYAFNDRTTAEWFAPAGFNRGGLGMALQAERKLSPTDRDNLYLANVNPIATFPGRGPVAYGQKTLQKNKTALDRVNVRRLLIELKRTIGNIANNLVFEQNTTTTRNRFLSQVNPYMESIQQRQGLYAYKVVMDDTNNTADVIDRNELVGQVYVQPTKTAEFIILDFNVTPTGASFE